MEAVLVVTGLACSFGMGALIGARIYAQALEDWKQQYHRTLNQLHRVQALALKHAHEVAVLKRAERLQPWKPDAGR